MANRAVLLIAILVVVIGLIEYGPTTAQAQVKAQRCLRPDFLKLMFKCGPYIRILKPRNSKPWKPCCDYLKVLDIPCTCSYVTKQMEKVVNVPKAIAIARGCGAYVKPGTKCGSYRVPRV